jgi:ATP-dependent helicase/DNAse subunit B
MDLHVYRNAQDRWHDLRTAARSQGAVLATNALTLDELVRRLTPDAQEATIGQRLAFVSIAVGGGVPVRYAVDALGELKAARVTPTQLRKLDSPLLAQYLENYDRQLQKFRLVDPQDRRWMAASKARESEWLRRFQSVVLHAIYDPNPAEFALLHNTIERLAGGGTVVLFNATSNVKPTRFAEWTWQRFVQDEKLADKTFPEFVRSAGPAKELLERLFVFELNDHAELLRPHQGLRILQCSGRYGEVEAIGAGIADLLEEGADPGEIAVVVRHINTYGEMIEDVFSRYQIGCIFETGVPLLRIPFIKYWMALLDLVSGDRPRDAMARVLGSAYHEPRIAPSADPEAMLAKIGYIDRRHLKASALAIRHGSVLAAQLERFELFLDELEHASATPKEFLERLQAPATLTERDRDAWRTLWDEIDAISAITGAITLDKFRQIAGEIAGIRTVRRYSTSTPPGAAGVRIVPPAALGHRLYRWVFAPGFVDGEIPAGSAPNPLLPEELVDALNKENRPRRIQSSSDRNRKEPLYLFLILDSATDRITLTWPGSTLEGNAIHSSIYIGEILRHYNESPVFQPSENRPRDRGDCVRAIATAWREGFLEDHHARDLLGEDLVRRAHWHKRGIERGDLGAGILPADVVFSPSELDALDDCPFVFLSRYRLKVRPTDLPDFEVSPMEVGILAHRILREFYSIPVGDSEGQALARMQEVIGRVLSKVDIDGQGERTVIDPSLWKIRRPQLVRALLEYAKFAVRDSRDGYETLPEYLDQFLPAAPLGETMLSGKPDRVAVRLVDGRLSGIRIDDFKYSSASTETSRQLQESFQIPVYAHLASRVLAADADVMIEGRYLLLRSPSTPVVSQAVDSVLIEEIQKRLTPLIEKVKLGNLHPQPRSGEDCRTCDYRRLCRLYGD